MAYLYAYDTVVHTYPVGITNSHGEASTTAYNYRLGRPLAVADPCDNTITYDYDCLGRSSMPGRR